MENKKEDQKEIQVITENQLIQNNLGYIVNLLKEINEKLDNIKK